MGGDDSAVEAKAATEKKLYRVSAGNYQIVDSSGVLKFASLKSDGVFLVDCSSELFVWVGPDAPKVCLPTALTAQSRCSRAVWRRGESAKLYRLWAGWD
eukprot:2375605-Rhodomonas_salina.1